jgi:hypothetical protein
MLHYTNNATTTLTAAVGPGDTTLPVASTSLFPQGVDFANGGAFYVTLESTLIANQREICKVIGMSVTALLVERGQDGTLAQSFSANTTRVERRAVAADYDNFVQAEELAAHVAAPDPHPQYATDADVAAGFTAHVAAADPHPQYATDAEVAGAITAHKAEADPHPQYAADADVTAAITDHVAQANPHTQYATNTFVTSQIASHEAKTDPHPLYLKAATNADITAKTSTRVGIVPASLDHLWSRFMVEHGVTVSAGAASQGNVPQLNAAGKLDMSVVPTTGGTTYRGTVDAVNNPPPSAIYYAGDFYYHVGVTGVVDPNWAGITGETVHVGDQLVWNGTQWSLIPNFNDASLFLFRDGSNDMAGPLNMATNEMRHGVVNFDTNFVPLWSSIVPLDRPPGGSRRAGELYTNASDMQLGFINAALAPVDLLALPFFAATAQYVPGQLVVRNGSIYRALVAISPGAFNPVQWTDLTNSSAGDSVTQTLHGFTADDIGAPLRFDGAKWVRSLDSATVHFGAVLAGVISQDVLRLVSDGVVSVALPVSGGAPLVVGTRYYASTTAAGKLTPTAPTDPLAAHPVLRALSSTTGIIETFPSWLAPTAYVDAQNTAQNAVIATKADKTYVDAQLALKANTADVDAMFQASNAYIDSENARQDANTLALIIALG